MTSGIIRNHAVLFGSLSFPFLFFCLTFFFLPLQPPSAPFSPRPSAPSSRSAARRIPSTARSPVAPRAPSSAFTVRLFSFLFSFFFSYWQPFPLLMPHFSFSSLQLGGRRLLWVDARRWRPCRRLWISPAAALARTTCRTTRRRPATRSTEKDPRRGWASCSTLFYS